MSYVIFRFAAFIIISNLAVNSGQSVNNSVVILPRKNGREKNREFSENKSFVNLVIDTKRENSGKRVKRRVLEECPGDDLKDAEENLCPPETSRQLQKYECCIYCPEQGTGAGCEPYNCTGNHICSSEHNPPRHIRLSLREKNIAILPINVFNGLSEVSELDLTRNSIQVLPHNVFNRLPQLTRLDLDRNKIMELKQNVFNGLSKLIHLDLGRNNIIMLSHNVFNGLSNLTHLYLDRNKIMELKQNVFNGLSKLIHLDLGRNNIIIIAHNAFNGLSNLTYLYLGGNNITELKQIAFNGLSELTHLDLDGNNITVFPQNLFSGLSELTVLSFGYNNLQYPPSNIFSGLSKLTNLILWYNKIKYLPFNLLSGLSELTLIHLGINNIATLPYNLFYGKPKLTKIFLNNNNITFVPYNLFRGLHNLQYLDLSDNRIAVIPLDLFSGLSNLIYLYMHSNEITDLPFNVFSEMVVDEQQYLRYDGSTVLSAGPVNIQFLDLSNNDLAHLPLLPKNLSYLNIVGNRLEVAKNMFGGLNNLHRLFTNVPFMCCVKPPSVEDRNCLETKLPLWMCVISPDLCKSKGDPISSCLALVSSTVLRVCLWIIGICALIGNLTVIIYRLLIDKDNINKSYSLFTLNLAVSDLLMGIYLLIIGVVDAYYEGIYAWNDKKWRNSILCTTAGILSSISSEMSTFLILMVTVDRLIVIVFPLSRLSQRNITWKHALYVSLTLWIVAVLLAIIPVVTMQSYFKGEFYSQSSVCLALPLKGDARPGTEYSFAVFVCLNSFIFLVIVIGQICIYISVRRTGRRIASSQNRQREMTVAKTLFFVVATDFCCWFPIGVMGIVSQFGIEIPGWIYAWVMVFVLPINAAINPFLYTATTFWRGDRRCEVRHIRWR